MTKHHIRIHLAFPSNNIFFTHTNTILDATTFDYRAAWFIFINIHININISNQTKHKEEVNTKSHKYDLNEIVSETGARHTDKSRGPLESNLKTTIIKRTHKREKHQFSHPNELIHAIPIWLVVKMSKKKMLFITSSNTFNMLHYGIRY